MKKIIFALSFFVFFSCSEEEENYDFTDDYISSDYDVNFDSQKVALNQNWEFAEFSKINSGKAIFYKAGENQNGFTVSVNAGHGTSGGNTVKTFSHPDKSPKVTGGTNAKGAVESMAVSDGMTFKCAVSEAQINLRVAVILRKMLLENGFNVLMIRAGDDVQLDNIARTVISNNCADIHITIHFDGDGKKYDKGCFYCGIPEELKFLQNVKNHCNNSEKLGQCIISGLQENGLLIYENGRTELDLTQTSFSTIPTVDIELGNQCTIPLTKDLEKRANGILAGVQKYFNILFL